MKKLGIVIATVIAAAALVSSATATDTFYEDEGFLCGMLTPGEGFLLTEDSSFVIYASGKSVLKCKAYDDYSGPHTVLNPKNTEAGCGYFNVEDGIFVDLPFWKSTHGTQGQHVLTCNGQYDTNAPRDEPQPDARAAGGAAGN
jgi:hypothetical protein